MFNLVSDHYEKSNLLNETLTTLEKDAKLDLEKTKRYYEIHNKFVNFILNI